MDSAHKKNDIWIRVTPTLHEWFNVGSTTLAATNDLPLIIQFAALNWCKRRFGPWEERRLNRALSPFSTRRLFSREATFSFVGIAFADVISDADKGKSRFARKKSPNGKRALVGQYVVVLLQVVYVHGKMVKCVNTRRLPLSKARYTTCNCPALRIESFSCKSFVIF